jgi:hypothetical protein
VRRSQKRFVAHFHQPSHVLSWVDSAPFPVCLLRYEDMKSQPMETFEKAVRFAKLTHNREQIQKSLDFSSFDTLAHQEGVNGFREKSASGSRFFRKGQNGYPTPVCFLCNNPGKTPARSYHGRQF